MLELKRQIAAAGDVLVREYVDDGYSGTLLDRPALDELRRDVKTNLFDGLARIVHAWRYRHVGRSPASM